MRMIGQIEGEAAARKFSDFLLAQGIENEVESDSMGGWAVWVHSEEQLEGAKTWLARFRADPGAGQFADAAAKAQLVRAERDQARQDYERRVAGRRNLFRPLTQYGFGPLTFGLIGVSVWVFFKSSFGNDLDPVLQLFISVYDVQGGIWARLAEGLPEVRHGQLWRLVTPIFMHGDVLHILFNMMWLADLGSMIEGRQSSLTLAVLVLGIAVLSNVSQFVLSGPHFLGMSGVVYGLIGYIWMRGKHDPGSGLFLHPGTVTMSVIWACLGILGLANMANTCHVSGFLVGVAWGYLSSLPHQKGMKR